MPGDAVERFLQARSHCRRCSNSGARKHRSGRPHKRSSPFAAPNRKPLARRARPGRWFGRSATPIKGDGCRGGRPDRKAAHGLNSLILELASSLPETDSRGGKMHPFALRSLLLAGRLSRVNTTGRNASLPKAAPKRAVAHWAWPCWAWLFGAATGSCGSGASRSVRQGLGTSAERWRHWAVSPSLTATFIVLALWLGSNASESPSDGWGLG